MTSTEPNEIKVVPAKKRRVPSKKRAAAPAPVVDAGKYAGLSVRDCCNGCNEKGCVISGKSYCAHPRKGGLHASEQQDNGALKRRREAEKVLGQQKLVVE